MARKRAHRETTSTEKATNTLVAEKLKDSVVRSAVKALLNDSTRQEKKKLKRASDRKKLSIDLGAEKYVTLGVTFRRAPFKGKLRPYAIPLKHSLFLEEEDDVILFVKDPEELVEEYLEQNGNGGVTKVMGVSALSKGYKTHEGRRELLGQYDHFLVDNRVAPMMVNLLGEPFITAKKMPLGVKMNKGVVNAIKKALSSTSLCPRQGTSTSIRVAKIDFEEEMIVENIIVAVEAVMKRTPGGWGNVQGLCIKTNKSPALPIYVTLAKQSGGKRPKQGEKADNKEESKEIAVSSEGQSETNVENMDDAMENEE